MSRRRSKNFTKKRAGRRRAKRKSKEMSVRSSACPLRRSGCEGWIRRFTAAQLFAKAIGIAHERG
jgi:hypothetical protein